jgi:hypothetical protein
MQRALRHRITSLSVGLRGRARGALPLVAAMTVALLVTIAVVPARAHAIDLFPLDDLAGSALKKVGGVALGGLKITASTIAQLLGAIVYALADLLIPKSLVRAGVGGIKWLVGLPQLGSAPAGTTTAVRMPHLLELRDTLVWIGVTLLPLQVVIAGGRAMLAPTNDGDTLSEVVERALLAGLGLIAFDWIWGALTRLVGLITGGLLSLPWMADGIERMLETLLIGGAAGSAVAAEFVIPLLLVAAGGTLLALLLVRIALEVIAALVFVLGGIALGVSPSGVGHRLFQAWLIAAASVFLLPVLWTIVFVAGAALMLDSRSAAGQGGFLGFVAQLYNVGAALVVFGVAIKLAKGLFAHAGGAIGNQLMAARAAARPGQGAAGLSAGAHKLAGRAVPQSVAAFSQQLRGGLAGGMTAARGAAGYPLRHPVRVAQAASYPLRRPVQATREAADGLRAAMSSGRVAAATAGDVASTHSSRAFERERHDGRFSARNADQRQARKTQNGQPSAPARSARVTGEPSPSIRPTRPAAATKPAPAPSRRAMSAARPGAGEDSAASLEQRAAGPPVRAGHAQPGDDRAWRWATRAVRPAGANRSGRGKRANRDRRKKR